MRRIRRAEAAVLACERAVVVALLIFTVGVAFLQVVLRGVFSAGLLWADTLLRHLVLWLGFLGAALATFERRQFAMDALVRKLRPGPRRRVHAGVHAVSALVAACLLWASVKFLKEEFASPSPLFTAGGVAVPAWTIELILPVGFLLLLFHTSIRLAEELTGTAPPEPELPADTFV